MNKMFFARHYRCCLALEVAGNGPGMHPTLRECCLLRRASFVRRGNSPYEAVIGLWPKAPIAALATQPVGSLGVGEYVNRLREYVVGTYKTMSCGCRV